MARMRQNSKPFSHAEASAVLHSYFGDVMVGFDDLGQVKTPYPRGYLDVDGSDVIHGRKYRVRTKEGRRLYEMTLTITKAHEGASEIRIQEMVEVVPARRAG